MTRNEIKMAIQRIGSGMAVPVANVRVAHLHVASFPMDLTMAAANYSTAAGCFRSDAQQLNALLNHTDSGDHDLAGFMLPLGDLDKLVKDLTNLHIFALQVRDGVQPCREMGAPIDVARLANTAKAVLDTAENIQANAETFDFHRIPEACVA